MGEELKNSLEIYFNTFKNNRETVNVSVALSFIIIFKQTDLISDFNKRVILESLYFNSLHALRNQTYKKNINSSFTILKIQKILKSNFVDFDENAHDKPSYLNLQYLQIDFCAHALRA